MFQLAATKRYKYRPNHWQQIVNQSILIASFQTPIHMILWLLLKGTFINITVGLLLILSCKALCQMNLWLLQKGTYNQSMSERVNSKCSVSDSIQNNPLAATKRHFYRHNCWQHIVNQPALNSQF
jgi:hypothetical protein